MKAMPTGTSCCKQWKSHTAAWGIAFNSSISARRVVKSALRSISCIVSFGSNNASSRARSELRVPIAQAATRLMLASKKIEADVHAVKVVPAHDLLHDGLQLVAEGDDMVAVPAYAAAHMEDQLGYEEQAGRYFIGDHLGRVKVAGVEAEGLVVLRGITQIESCEPTT